MINNNLDETYNNIDNTYEQLNIFSQHLYDNIFSYIFFEQTQLFLPLINEAFNLNYDNDAPIKIESQNFMSNKKKKVVDAFLSIEDNLFHFECESKNGEILLRLEDYDRLISNRFENKTLYTAVLYIRNTKIGDYGLLEDGRKVPYIKVQDYSLQEMLKSKLYILLPYYIMRYESSIKGNIESKYEGIVSDLKGLYNEIERISDNGLTDKKGLSDSLCKMCVEITLRISKNSTFSDYLRKEGAMPMSWMTYEEEIEQAKRETLTTKERTEIQAIQSIMDKLQKSYEDACDILGYNKEKYKFQFKA